MGVVQMNLHPSETYYVGDLTMDMVAALAAGSKPIAALWDERVKPLEMIKEKPFFLAESAGMIANFLS